MLAALMLLPGLALAQAKKGEKKAEGGVDQALMDIERKWTAAEIKNDAAVLEDILADSWTGTSSDGKVTTRAQALDEFKTSKVTHAEVSEMKVRMINPDTAIVTGIWTGTGTDAKGQKLDASQRWTDIFANQGGKWKCVVSHNTPIKK
jgi:ketosteroid isomerase-like protein